MYEGPCNVLASAGSGKTGVLVERFAKLVKERGVAPGNILAVTFNKDAQDNIARRLETLLPGLVDDKNVRTFHSLGLEIVQAYDSRRPALLERAYERENLMEQALSDCGIFRPDGRMIADALHYVSNRKNRGLTPQEAAKEADADPLLNRVYIAYERHKTEQRRMDWDDMLLMALRLLRTEPAALRYYRDKYRFILADEMQDANAAQYGILRLLAEERRNLFLVSDPLQAIYGWRGSDNRFVLDFDRDWPGGCTVTLNTNFRSCGAIVEAANRFARCIPESAHPHYVESAAAREYGQAPDYRHYKTGEEELLGIVAEIRRLREVGRGYGEIAVLARTNALLQRFETGLFRAGIPCTGAKGRSFTDFAENKLVLSYLRLARDDGDDEAFRYIYNRPTRYLGKAFLEQAEARAARTGEPLLRVMDYVAERNPRYARSIRQLCSLLRQLRTKRFRDVGARIAWLREAAGLDSYVAKTLSEDDDDSKLENLDELQRQATGYKTLAEYLDFVVEFGRTRRTGGDAVRLMTIHKAKGLEFPVVFLPGVNQGLLPHGRNPDLAEEQRLMYVAMTRAMDCLHISSTSKCMGKAYQVSEFIPAVFPETAKKRRGTKKKETKRKCMKEAKVK